MESKVLTKELDQPVLYLDLYLKHPLHVHNNRDDSSYCSMHVP